MIIRSKAPLRLGLAGGGSDVSPYSDIYGGLVLNATINLYTYATIEETNDGLVSINSYDSDCRQSFPLTDKLEIDGKASLIKVSIIALYVIITLNGQALKSRHITMLQPVLGLVHPLQWWCASSKHSWNGLAYRWVIMR